MVKHLRPVRPSSRAGQILRFNEIDGFPNHRQANPVLIPTKPGKRSYLLFAVVLPFAALAHVFAIRFPRAAGYVAGIGCGPNLNPLQR